MPILPHPPAEDVVQVILGPLGQYERFTAIVANAVTIFWADVRPGAVDSMQLPALAYNLGNVLRRLALPRAVKHWSLTILQEKLIKIGAKVVRNARYATFQMAEVAVPRQLSAAIPDRIQRFGVPPPLVQRE